VRTKELARTLFSFGGQGMGASGAPAKGGFLELSPRQPKLQRFSRHSFNIFVGGD
jgi:hypothetical protein